VGSPLNPASIRASSRAERHWIINAASCPRKSRLTLSGSSKLYTEICGRHLGKFLHKEPYGAPRPSMAESSTTSQVERSSEKLPRARLQSGPFCPPKHETLLLFSVRLRSFICALGYKAKPVWLVHPGTLVLLCAVRPTHSRTMRPTF